MPLVKTMDRSMSGSQNHSWKLKIGECRSAIRWSMKHLREFNHSLFKRKIKPSCSYRQHYPKGSALPPLTTQRVKAQRSKSQFLLVPKMIKPAAATVTSNPNPLPPWSRSASTTSSKSSKTNSNKTPHHPTGKATGFAKASVNPQTFGVTVTASWSSTIPTTRRRPHERVDWSRMPKITTSWQLNCQDKNWWSRLKQDSIWRQLV